MNPKKKVLVITYYWPPSGGAGVQRWLKLTKYLAENGVEVHVLSVNPQKASYLQVDESLINDVHSNIKVHLSDSFEPINIYSRLVGKSKVPTAGFSNVNEQHWSQKIISSIRSHLFIPDPRISWKNYAYKEALTIIEAEKIDNIITTSPPHSVQLVGLKLKRKLKDKINWTVDFRDPWTDIYYYHLLNHSKLSHRINLKKERQVIEESDKIVTVSEGFKKSFLSKTNTVSSDKIQVISNAYDADDFKNSTTIKPTENVFQVSYIGTMSEKYNPEIFFQALGKLIKNFPDAPIQFVSTGVVSERIQTLIVSYLGKDKAIFHSTVSHDKAVEAMLEAHILLLVIPEFEGIVPGKTFEYLATKRRIISIGKGDNAEIIAKCEAGMSFSRDEKEQLYNYLKLALTEYLKGVPFVPNEAEIDKLSWSYKAQEMMELL